MDLYVACLIILSITAINGISLQKLLKLLARRQLLTYGYEPPLLDVPRYLEDLPIGEPMLAGHTLIRPSFGMLKSSIKFPHSDKANGFGVYGNPDKIGISYGRNNEYVLHTNFRKSPRAVVVIIVDSKKTDKRKIQTSYASKMKSNMDYEENNAAEGLDNKGSPQEEDDYFLDYRKRVPLAFELNNDLRETSLNTKAKTESSSDEESEDSSSSDTSETESDKNPGNPFTVQNSKYIQNWLWNYEMTGDHMNINPHAPLVVEDGTKHNVFYGRKWWYFNQDDYIPLR